MGIRRTAILGLLAVALGQGGCFRPFFLSPSPVLSAYYPNPLYVTARDHQVLWENLVDVVDDFFDIQREEPVRQFDTILTSGRIDTYPKVGATIFEPWHKDSADRYSRWEATFQSIRRRAEIRVDPRDGGYWITVLVFKELEDLPQPLAATTSSATFRNDSSLTRVISPIGEQQTPAGWIPLGRDTALEQRILEGIGVRFGLLPAPAVSPPGAPNPTSPSAGITPPG